MGITTIFNGATMPSLPTWIILTVLVAMLSLTAMGRDPTMEVKSRAVDSVFKLEATRGAGTGFVVKARSGRKVLISNGHVCEIADQERFFMASVVNTGTPVPRPVTVVENWIEHDLCVLTAPIGAPALELGSTPRMDDKIFLLGYPGANFVTVTSGYYLGILYDVIFNGRDIDQCKGKKYRVLEMEFEDDEGRAQNKKVCTIHGMWWIGTAQTDPGGSGSPVLDGDGKVVGVLSFIRGNSSWGGGVPISDLKRLLDKY